MVYNFQMLQTHHGHSTAQRFFTSANAGSYEAVAHCATLGRDRVWKRRLVEMVRNNQSVLELACGTGVLSSMLASSGKNVIGIDLVLEYLLSSRHKLDLPVTQGTAEVLPFRNESFDAVVSSYLPKYVDSRILAQECWRILKPGGVAVFHDFTYPRLRWMRILWNAYFAILRFCGLFLPAWRPVFQQLDGVIRRSRWDEQLFESLRSEGFANIICESHTAGSSAIVRADKP